MMEEVDVAIIGAGWHGIAAAKTYLAAYPTQKMVILDGGSSAGGVWAKERIYQGLKTNNVLGSYEFSDFPMSDKYFAVRRGQHIPGEVVHAYLAACVERFGLQNKIRLGCRVDRAEYTSDCNWLLSIFQPSTGAQKTLKTSKLIVATGLTSRPIMPQFAGVEDFRAGSQLAHVQEFASLEAHIVDSKKRVAVLGGSKSAWDVVYSCASRGLDVDWVIRESGFGPTWMAPAYVGWPFTERLLESFPVTRLCSLFSPCAWNKEAGTIYTWLHRSWLGRKIVDAFWAMMQLNLERTNKYNEHPETQKLRPWVSPFWVATSLGILNYPADFFALVREGKVRVHVADIDSLSRRRVHLSNSQELDVDILICCTGWEETSGIRFSPEHVSAKLGFPGSPDVIPKDLCEKVNHLIHEQFPKLRNQPPFKQGRDRLDRSPAPLRLARFMVPPALFPDRSIVFLGHTMTLNTTLVAEVQSLWAAAFLNNELPAASPVTAMGVADWMLEAAKHTEFGRRRSPRANGGHRYPNFVFDILPYLDLLLRDLGISPRRKAGFWAHWMQPHGVRDYCGLATEWRASVGNKQEKKQMP